MKKKQIALLGSTGSIGTNTLEIAKHLSDEIEVVALAAHSNIERLEEQAHTFHPQLIAVYDKDRALELQKRLPHLLVMGGMEGLNAVAAHPKVNFVISAIVGAIAIEPTLTAIDQGKTVGLVNKEVLVAAGDLIMKRAKEKQSLLIPIDSEHSAIFQCLNGESLKEVNRIILTASGGPFRTYPQEAFSSITPEIALQHPNWNMGKKVTIDSSTLMNKGLEVIEAFYLFDLEIDQIQVVIHPQSIVHSFVEFIDGSMVAQMGVHDMKIPIQYALTYPSRKRGIVSCIDFLKYPKLEFYHPDSCRFPCLNLAYEAIREGGSMPCYMNAANEVLVDRFLNGEISWIEIGQKLEKLMLQQKSCSVHDLETVLAVDQKGRQEALSV
jgi:1-deoxy-D-xylulose-5-phosphate reductoisomerase